MKRIKLKSEKGSITLYVLVALFLITIGLISTYVITANKQSADLEVAGQIKAIYGKDTNNINEVYNSLISK